MKSIFKRSAALFLSLTMIITCVVMPNTVFAASLSKPSEDNNELEYQKGEAIVVLNDGCSKKLFTNAAKYLGKGVSVKDTYEFDGENSFDDINVATVKSSTLSTKKLVAKLNDNPSVKYACPNYIKHATDITDDEYSSFQWALDNQGQNNGLANMDTKPSTLWSEASDTEQVVAIVDTGIDYTNPDLKDIVWKNPLGSKLVGKYGYDFTDTIKDASPLDDNGHGSHCAGIIAASADNQIGVSGINKSNVKIMACKVLDEDGSGDTESILSAYEYIYRALKLGVNIVGVNNSFGGFGDSDEQKMYDAIFDKLGDMGAVSFIAAGNDGYSLDGNDIYDDFKDFMDVEAMDVPACSSSKYTVTVAASNEKGELASFSNYGSYVDVAAPGTDILSTVSSDCFNPTIYDDAKRASLCASMQTYDSFTEGDFGTIYELPQFNDTLDIIDALYVTPSTSDENYFGKAKNTYATVDIKTDKMGSAVFAIPFTLDDENSIYAVSFNANIMGDDSAILSAYDCPLNALTSVDAFEESMDYEFDRIGGQSDTNGMFWDHISGTIDVKKLAKNNSYTPDKERAIVFVVGCEKSCTVSIDDFAVSKQGVNPEEFGKYDFYNGTSMATPYALGAYALIRAARPDASVLSSINMLENTGIKRNDYTDKIESGRTVSLYDIDSIPPMITSAEYNENGYISIGGSFKDITSVTLNGNQADIISQSDSEIIVPDSCYSTRKLEIIVSNALGSDKYSCVITKKLNPNQDEFDYICDYFLPAGNKTYGITSDGMILAISAREDEDDFDFDFDDFYGEINPEYAELATLDFIDCGMLDNNAFDKESSRCEITSAAYTNNKIYMIVDVIYCTNSSVEIGRESKFVSFDLNKGETTVLCDVPYSNAKGYTLAAYNGSVYLIGGYDCDNDTFISNVYKYASTTKSFTVQSSLETATAYGSAIQYDNCLVYMYGANEAGTIPAPQVFDGKEWKQSEINFDIASKPEEFEIAAGKNINLYSGSLAIGNGGVLCSGAYIYGYGNLYLYSPLNDVIYDSDYCYQGDSYYDNFVISSIPGEIFGYGIDFDNNAIEDARSFEEETTYPEIFEHDSDYGFIMTDCEEGVMYGNKMRVYVFPDDGYVALKVTAGGKKYDLKYSSSISGYYADVVVNKQCFDITMAKSDYKLVKPAKVGSFKATGAGSKAVTLSWKKPTRAEGYVVQEYKNNKWTTIKTITNANTVSYKITSMKPATHKYRVLAYAKYDGRTFYSAASSSVSVYCPANQSISKLTASKKAFNVKYKKDTKATGYEIQYATSSSFSGSKTVTVSKNSTASKDVKSLSAKKKYYVRVRSYKTINGKNVYGAWSASKSVTTK